MDVVTNTEFYSTVRLITVSRDGNECVVGRPDLGIFVDVPEPGAILIEALQSGSTLAEATRLASISAQQDVDGGDFIDGLREAGLLDPISSGDDGQPGHRRIRWIEGISQRKAAFLFGRTAWTVYGGAAAFWVSVLILRSDLRPSYEDVWFLSDPVVSVLAFLPVAIVLSMMHEAWHWLAGRAMGVPAIFRVSHRGIYLVFETDLTQIVALPRRRRYGPFFAGMAFDSMILAIALAGRLAYRADMIALPPTMDRGFGVVIFALCFTMCWQWAGVFLRTDVYAILANALRCHNLYRVTWLTTKNRFVRLNADEQTELADAHPRDIAVARWFAVVYLAGLIAIVWLVLSLNLPAIIGLGGWVISNVVHLSPTSLAFWEGVVVLCYLALVWLTPPLLALRERRLRQKGRLL